MTWNITDLLAFHRSTFGGARMEADPAPTPDAPADPPTPSADPSATFTQADVDRIVGDRLKREQGKYADYDALKAKAAQFEQLEQASRTEHERAVAEAEAAGTSKGMLEAVRAEFRYAAKGALSDAARDALLEDIDLSKYLTDKGQVDADKIGKKVAALAPDPNEVGSDFGQGVRTPGKTDPGPGMPRLAHAYATSKTP